MNLMAKIQNDAEVKRVKYQLQTILSQMKRLIMDSSGRVTRLDPADKTLKDIFGQKNIIKRLRRCNKGSQTLYVINSIGAGTLYKMLSSRKLMNTLLLLVDARDRMEGIEQILDKAERKGKTLRKAKELAKEHSYVKKTYKEGVKMMRKHLGIKKVDSNDYKKRYAALKEFSKDDYEFFDGFNLGAFDFDDDDDEDDDGLNLSFRRNAMSSKSIFAEDDEEDSDDDDDEEDERLGNIEESIDKITQILQNVLKDKQPVTLADTKTNPNPQTSVRTVYTPNNDYMGLSNGIRNIENTIGTINQSIGLVCNTMDKFGERLDTLERAQDSIMTILIDDDDDETELAPAENVRAFNNKYIDDPRVRLSGNVSVGMSHDELVSEMYKEPEIDVNVDLGITTNTTPVSMINNYSQVDVKPTSAQSLSSNIPNQLMPE